MSGAEDLFKVQCSKFKGETKMVRLSYELSVVFDHNPIIEIGHGYELFKVGLRFAGKRRRELCAAAAPSREPVRAEEARRCGVFSGALRRGYVARTWPRWMNAAFEFRVSTCLALMISAHARSDRGVADT